MPRPALLPVVLAVMVTAANAVKPVQVDDTAYLAFAVHIADHPLDPYGFKLFWYSRPEPAMDILCPPVLPYWLAAGVRVVGPNPHLLKLSLFPLVWLLFASANALLRRFARGAERPALVLLAFSPMVLVGLNLMLDVPAVAVGLAAVSAFVKAIDRRSWWFGVLAGVLAALAVQTKYTMLVLPPLFVWYAMTRRQLPRPAFAILATSLAVGVAAFAGWEVFLLQKYKESHFLYHVRDQSAAADPDAPPKPLGERVGKWLEGKRELVPPLVAYLGCLAAGFGLWAGRAAGFPRAVVLAAGLFLAGGFAWVAVAPHEKAVLVWGKDGGEKLTVAGLVWRSTGGGVLFTATGCALALTVRLWRKGELAPGPRRGDADGLFLAGWVAGEVLSYFVLSPFPAARRVFGLAVAVGFLAARGVSRVGRANPDRRPPAWVLPAAVGFGLIVAAIDTYDAFPERWAAARAAELAKTDHDKETVYFAGHWGFQWYCGRAGMEQAAVNITTLQPGDRLVLPLFPDGKRFYRPHPGPYWKPVPDDVAELIGEVVWDDRLSAQTVPNFYGGADPVIGRDHPRIRVAVYRITAEWTPEPEPDE